MKNEKLTLLSFLICCLLSSCVSLNKYEDLVKVKDYLEQENKRLTNQENENSDLRATNRSLKLELDQAKAKIVELESSFNSLNRNYQDLAVRYNAIIADNRQIGAGSATEKQYWEEELAKKQLELENKAREIQTLRYTVEQKEKRVQELLELLRKEGN